MINQDGITYIHCESCDMVFYDLIRNNPSPTYCMFCGLPLGQNTSKEQSEDLR